MAVKVGLFGLAPLMILFSVMKLCSTKSLISISISLEMIMVAIYFMYSESMSLSNSIHPIISFLVIVVLEGALSLLIITSLFRDSGVESGVALFF